MDGFRRSLLRANWVLYQGPATARSIKAATKYRSIAKLRTHRIPAAIANFRCDEFLPLMLRINPKIGIGVVISGSIGVIRRLMIPRIKPVTGAFSLSVKEFFTDAESHAINRANRSADP